MYKHSFDNCFRFQLKSGKTFYSMLSIALFWGKRFRTGCLLLAEDCKWCLSMGKNDLDLDVFVNYFKRVQFWRTWKVETLMVKG